MGDLKASFADIGNPVVSPKKPVSAQGTAWAGGRGVGVDSESRRTMRTGILPVSSTLASGGTPHSNHTHSAGEKAEAPKEEMTCPRCLCWDRHSPGVKAPFAPLCSPKAEMSQKSCLFCLFIHFLFWGAVDGTEALAC